MKETALSQVHAELGAKMVPFAGYNMPVTYAGLKHEHEVVRTKVGVFDVSHMGEFFVRGENAEALLQKVTSNDVSKLVVGKAQYCYLPNNEGGIIDDLIIYKIADQEFMLIVNASNIDKDWNWISSQNDVGAELVNESDEWSILAIQGPKAAEAMQSLTSVDLKAMKFYSFEINEFAGVQDVIISATGYTGSGGFEIYVRNKDIKQVWDKVFEAGLGWITKFTKEFINSEDLKAEKEAGIKNKLVGFELIDKGVPRQGYPILNAEGEEIGRVTSGTMSPSLNIAIGMGYVPVELATEGSEIYIGVRNKSLAAKVVKTPFYKG